jgi:hypothetical protein
LSEGNHSVDTNCSPYFQRTPCVACVRPLHLSLTTTPLTPSMNVHESKTNERIIKLMRDKFLAIIWRRIKY